MRFFAYILIPVLFFGVVSCNWNNREDAMKLSNDLTSVNDSLYKLGKIWLDEFKIAVNTKNFSQLPPLRQNLQSFIERKIEYVNNMKDVGDSAPLRKAELDVLQFEKETVLPKFLVFENFGENTTDEELTEAYKLMMSTTTTEQEKLNTLYDLINTYADKNDFPKPIN